MIWRNAYVLLVSTALFALPRVAAACPVCNANGEEESRVAFILTTVFLSALPVAMIGVGAWFIWRRIRAAERAPRLVTHHSHALRGRGSAA